MNSGVALSGRWRVWDENCPKDRLNRSGVSAERRKLPLLEMAALYRVAATSKHVLPAPSGRWDWWLVT
jgi:hypothetical protein